MADDIGAFWARTGLQELSGTQREALGNYPGGNGEFDDWSF